MKNIIKSAVILGLASAIFLGSAGATFADHAIPPSTQLENLGEITYVFEGAEGWTNGRIPALKLQNDEAMVEFDEYPGG